MIIGDDPESPAIRCMLNYKGIAGLDEGCNSHRGFMLARDDSSVEDLVVGALPFLVIQDFGLGLRGCGK
jgi:hypothetical protein